MTTVDEQKDTVTVEEVKDVVRRYAEQNGLPVINAAVVIEYLGYPTEMLLVVPKIMPYLVGS